MPVGEGEVLGEDGMVGVEGWFLVVLGWAGGVGRQEVEPDYKRVFINKYI